MITMTEIARLTGVSQPTVSRVLNGNTSVKPEVREKVLACAREHNFQPNAMARGLVGSGTKLIGVVLTDISNSFFADLEKYMEQAGFEDADAVPRVLAIWEKYVSEKPRPGYRPLGLSYSAQGTYNGEEFLDAEQITKNKLYIYTREKNTGFDRRFLMKRVGEGWKIDAVQERLNGWQRTEL